MSTANNGIERFPVSSAVIGGVVNSLIPLSPDGISNVGTYFINAGLPCVTLGGKPRVLGQTYLEVDGGQTIDFHYGTANGVPDWDARIECVAPIALAGESSTSMLNLECSALLVTVPVAEAYNMMDVLGAGLVIPDNSPFMAIYAISGLGAVTVPVATPAQRFMLWNTSGADVIVNWGSAVSPAGATAYVNGGVIPNNRMFYVTSFQSNPDDYEWIVGQFA